MKLGLHCMYFFGAAHRYALGSNHKRRIYVDDEKAVRLCLLCDRGQRRC
jgi:hypothetical protein